MTPARSARIRRELRHPSQIRTSNRSLSSLAMRAFPFGTILAWTEDPDRQSSRPLRMQASMENNEKKPFWEKNSRGFWLIVCLAISALAGWVMFHLDILH
jgi:hypothetical protein